MPTPTYDLISSQILTSDAASVSFSNLPTSGYRDLILVMSVKAVTGNGQGRLTFGGVPGSDYNTVRAQGSISPGASSDTTSAMDRLVVSGQYINIPTTDTTQIIFQLFDYRQSIHKSCLWRLNQPANETQMGAGRIGTTNALTSITWEIQSRNTASGSSFHLYGIAS